VLNPILVIIIGLSSIHFLIPYLYYRYMSRIARKPWNIEIDRNYEPKVTMIIPTYNEASVITKKLQSLKGIEYPPEKLEVIIVDSSSTDNTSGIAKEYLKSNVFPFKIKILEEKERGGKAKALNLALKQTENQIIATSDADSYWEPSALRRALSYLADPKVGAVTGREEFLNLNRNTLTLAEGMYRRVYNTLRIGESKIHSTQFFQGEFSIYKRWVFEKFNDAKGSDDSGTVKNVIANGYRTIFVPEAVFSDLAPSTLRGRTDLKQRRALHLIHALVGAAKLKREKKFPQPAFILYANFFIHLINPFLIFAFLATVAYLIYLFPLLLLFIFPPLFIKKVQILVVSYLTSNFALILSVLRYIRGEEQSVWKKIDEMRR
jgi:biofilm PGA synthesis N-glycosyltransferase PgaC